MDKNLQVLKSEVEIQNRIIELAKEIRATSDIENLTVVGILDDAFVFLADLIRAMNAHLSCRFIRVTTVHHAMQTNVVFTSEFDPLGLDILIVGGVLDTGITLDHVSRHLSERGAKTVRTCVLLDKPDDRRVDIKPDFIAFQTDERYVFGYGLGIENRYRELPYLAFLQEKEA